MPTPDTSSSRSRQSSYAFSAPFSLRFPSSSTSRKVSDPLVSAVSAQGASNSRSTGQSQAKLSQHLNDGADGRQMGLRSRQGSAATIRSSHASSSSSRGNDTISGNAGASNEAGPSRRPSNADPEALPHAISNNPIPSTSTKLTREISPNPKQSSTWLRWNSPAPSFPRSKSPSLIDQHQTKPSLKGKGKARESGNITLPSSETTQDPFDRSKLTSSPIHDPDIKHSSTGSPSVPPPLPPDPTATAKPRSTDGTKISFAATPLKPSASGRSWFGWSSPAPAKSETYLAQTYLAQAGGGSRSTSNDVKVGSDTTAPKDAEPITELRGSKGESVPSEIHDVKATSIKGLPNKADPKALLGAQQTTNEEVMTEVQTKGTQISRVNSGWMSYLGWTSETQSKSPPGMVPVEDRQSSARSSTQITPQESTSTLVPESNLKDTKLSNVQQTSEVVAGSAGTPDEPHSAAQQSKTGWGSYLYSFVVPPTPPRKSPTAQTVQPSDPVQDQKPAKTIATPDLQATATQPTAEPVVMGPPALPATLTAGNKPKTAATISPPTNTKTDAVDPSVDGNVNHITGLPAPNQRSRNNSTNSTLGWLNYLAFRASQKKIANPSTLSIKSGQERVKSDAVNIANEEVMDFSSDPNFPSGSVDSKKFHTAKSTLPIPKSASKLSLKSPDPGQTASKSGKANGEAEQPQLVPTPNGKSTDPRKRKLSNTSTRSGGTQTPIPSSPKPPSTVSKAIGKEAVKNNTKSSLPNGPEAIPPASNLVIPSFEATFNRPPRSLPPLGHPQPGVTGATSSLAWKAIGAMGNYVYGGDSRTGSKESRGMRDGRGVGDDLPRKLGFSGTAGADDGWKGVRRVVIVGVHGWFPAKMLNSVIGEPTGTSVKFANMMAQAVKEFFEKRGVNQNQLRITTIPLEGEGTIEHRVDRLYKSYLSNPAWINDLRRADAILFAAHSQGCIVTTHLISRMIAQGHIRTRLNKDAVARCEWAFGLVGVVPDSPKRKRTISSLLGAEGGYQKVAMLSMCGVHQGPLYSISTSTVIQPYLQWFENAAARELFEFQDSTSAVSVAYQKALGMILENGVKMVLLASLNDQVVPIYGASYSTATHPLLLRALFVDGASYSQSDFMTNLLAFAFMLRNAGIDDQRLIEHLSEATAGSLTGLGHSSPYEELACYALAVDYLFLTGDPPSTPTSSLTSKKESGLVPLSIEPFSAREARNDYELPWIMRALVDSPEVKDLFPGELQQLKEGIRDWRPVTKALKEIKRKLEPMAGRQSKLRPLMENGSSGSTPGSPAGSIGLRKDW